jgi:hypothetical protein
MLISGIYQETSREKNDIHREPRKRAGIPKNLNLEGGEALH